MQIITIANQKGGTGKTATAVTWAQMCAHNGFKTLVIDLDPQGNLTYTLKAKVADIGSYGLLTGRQRGLIEHTESGVDIIPASWNLATIKTEIGSAKRLQKALEPIKGKYDYIFIDTPPTAGELQYNALMASDGLVIPLSADIYSLQGLYQMAETARKIKQSNSNLDILGVLVTRYNGRSVLTKQMLETIKQAAEQMGIPFIGQIREGIAIKEAAALQANIAEYAPKSNAYKDYVAAAEKILKNG